MDLDDPAGVLRWWLDEALTVLDRSAERAGRGDLDELLDEFPGYWSALSSHRVSLMSFPGGGARIVRGHMHRGRLRAVNVDGARPARSQLVHRALASLAPEAVAYLPLSTPLLPPPRGERVSLGFLRGLVDGQPGTVRDALRRRAVDLPSGRQHRHYLFSQPAPDGQLSVFGATAIVRRDAPDPLSAANGTARIVPWSVDHHYRRFQSVRGGAVEALAYKRVLIVGCGSLGGHVALMLAQAGVGTLHLVDDDRMKMENAFRHVLSDTALGVPKAQALACHLERCVPGVNVGHDVARVESFDSSILDRRFDVVCLAMGEPAIERDIVGGRLGRTGGPSIVTGWIEPLSLGGSAVVSRPGRPGCLECTFTDAHGRLDLNGRTSFVATGQIATRSLFGCEGAFTPYTAIDAAHSAAVVARAVQDDLMAPGSVFYRHWRGGTHLARQAGVEPSHWHGAVNRHDELAIDELLVNSGCRVCGGFPR